MHTIRPKRIAYMAILVFIILLALFILISIAMILSMDQSAMKDHRGAIYEMVDTILRIIEPVTVTLSQVTGYVIDQFWSLIGSFASG